MKKAQAATEYLIVLAVVIIIALIVIGVMGGIPGIGGAGFDPNQGGIPAQTANPNATRELQTGQSATGEEIV